MKSVRLTCLVLPDLCHPSHVPRSRYACVECRNSVSLVIASLTTVGPFDSRIQPLGGGDWDVSATPNLVCCGPVLTGHSFNGEALGSPYEPPKYVGPEPTANIENAKIYHGSCHC